MTSSGSEFLVSMGAAFLFFFEDTIEDVATLCLAVFRGWFDTARRVAERFICLVFGISRVGNKSLGSGSDENHEPLKLYIIKNGHLEAHHVLNK
jgi:hypothetical protein